MAGCDGDGGYNGSVYVCMHVPFLLSQSCPPSSLHLSSIFFRLHRIASHRIASSIRSPLVHPLDILYSIIRSTEYSTESTVQNPQYRIQNTEYRVQSTKYIIIAGKYKDILFDFAISSSSFQRYKQGKGGRGLNH